MTRLNWIAMAWVGLVGCAADVSTDDPVGVAREEIRFGAVPTSTEFRNVATIARYVGGQLQPFCSGTLISTSDSATTSRVVLTAAHCAAVLAPPNHTIPVYALFPSGTAYLVTESEEDWRYKSDRKSDWAILRLSSQVAGPAYLYKGTLPTAGASLAVAGWGLDGRSADGQGTLGRLLKGTLSLNRYVSQSSPYAITNQLLESLSAPTATSLCSGDSGGPAFYAGKVLGVASSVAASRVDAAGNPICTSVTASYHVNVQPYLSSITSTAANFSQGSACGYARTYSAGNTVLRYRTGPTSCFDHCTGTEYKALEMTPRTWDQQVARCASLNASVGRIATRDDLARIRRGTNGTHLNASASATFWTADSFASTTAVAKRLGDGVETTMAKSTLLPAVCVLRYAWVSQCY